MKKPILLMIGTLICAVLVLVRIFYVTGHARRPVVNQVAQGEGAVYKGIEYQIVDAVLWEYADFFKAHSELEGYAEDNVGKNQRKLLVVKYKVSRVEEDGSLETYIPLQYYHLFNGIDIFMLQAMNPSLFDGTFHSGDTMLVPYELYRENLLESQWQEVEEGKTVYKTVLGMYPEKNEMLITDVDIAEDKDETVIEK